jgi:hypothetical protein
VEISRAFLGSQAADVIGKIKDVASLESQVKGFLSSDL